MTKKATPKIYFILLLLFILLTGCSDKKASESAVSPEAEAVITAMFTAPNEELYSSDASNVIGEILMQILMMLSPILRKFLRTGTSL